MQKIEQLPCDCLENWLCLQYKEEKKRMHFKVGREPHTLIKIQKPHSSANFLIIVKYLLTCKGFRLTLDLLKEDPEKLVVS